MEGTSCSEVNPSLTFGAGLEFMLSIGQRGVNFNQGAIFSALLNPRLNSCTIMVKSRARAAHKTRGQIRTSRIRPSTFLIIPDIKDITASTLYGARFFLLNVLVFISMKPSATGDIIPFWIFDFQRIKQGISRKFSGININIALSGTYRFIRGGLSGQPSK